jgi:hypothetical protein
VYNDGTANRTVTGVVSGIPFNVFTSPVTANTTYTLVSVAGANSCARTTGFTGSSTTITVNPLPQGSLTANGPICVTGAGQLTFTASVGTGPYTVVYNDGTANRTATGVVSGTPFTVFTSPVTTSTTYTLVSVEGANSCARTTGFTGGSATITVQSLVTYYQDFDNDGFGNPAVSQSVCTGTPAGYVTNNTDCNDNAYSLTNSCSTVVNIKMFIEGYYDTATHAMRPVLANQGVGSSSTNVDNVTIELRNATTHTLVATTTTMLHTNGIAVATFNSAPVGSFYIVVKHRNTLETWSAAPYSVGATPTTYDFSNVASKAYGNNMKMLETGVYGFYSGDINQDGFIEAADYDSLNADTSAFAEGFFNTDLNGDGFVEGGDYDVINSNTAGFVEAIRP